MPTKGQVKWFDPKKGYGFIIGPEGQDVFIHYSQIVADGFRALKDGEWVDYELIQGDKGWQARDVQPTGQVDSPPKDTPVEMPADHPPTDMPQPQITPPTIGGYEGAT